MLDTPCGERLSRRDVLKSGALGAACLFGTRAWAARDRPPTILLHSGWQIENIGDIAHSPGVLALLEKHVPEAQILYWPNSINAAIEQMLLRRFPNLTLVRGTCDGEGRPTADELQRAFAQADVLVHGSGPSVVGHARLSAWRKETGRPYGIYGVTIQSAGRELKQLLQGASFVFTRETHSLENMKQAGIDRPVLGFAPDGTFALDVTDDDKGLTYLEQQGLAGEPFICVVPRLRYTPYHKIRKVGWSQEEIRRREEHNAKHAERDHGKLREVIIRWVRETGGKVLCCPEMTYALEIIDPLLVEPLPRDVRKNVVARRSYWLPDEAASVYRQALAVISMECHSPIISAAMGTPGLYVRQPEDTIKGQMWYDIGLTDWVFEIDETTGRQIGDRLMQVHGNRDAAQAYLSQAMQGVAARHAATMGDVRAAAGLKSGRVPDPPNG